MVDERRKSYQRTRNNMKLKKGYLEVFFLTLKGTEGVLNLAEARRRDSYMKTLGAVLEDFYSDRKVIYEKFCTKNEDGTPDVQEGKYNFPTESVEELTKELVTLTEEEVELTGEIKDLLEKSEYRPKFGETEVIDKILELA